MPAQWTAEIVGKMHLYGITGKRLAAALGWNPKYLSQVLNSPNPPKGAEDKLRVAMEQLISGTSTS